MVISNVPKKSFVLFRRELNHSFTSFLTHACYLILESYTRKAYLHKYLNVAYKVGLVMRLIGNLIKFVVPFTC